MDVVLPGGRDARGTLNEPGDDGDTRPDAVVVACPPHPRYGGDRSDRRLTATSDALGNRGIACLRFDYGEWDEGRGERTDVKNAVRWARERYERVGLFGFSFGATVALCAAADVGGLWAVCALAPDGGRKGMDAVAALDGIDAPTNVLYAEHDSTADWKPVVERARELDAEAAGLAADHFFVGQSANAAERAAAFLDRSR